MGVGRVNASRKRGKLMNKNTTVAPNCRFGHLSSPPIKLPPHLTTATQFLECDIDMGRREEEQRASAQSLRKSGDPAILLREYGKVEEQAAAALDCTASLSSTPKLLPHLAPQPLTAWVQHLECSLEAAQQSSSSTLLSSSLLPLPLSHAVPLASSSLTPPSMPLSRSLSPSPSDDPAILSDTHNKSYSAGAAPPSHRRTRRTRSQAVDVAACTAGRQSRMHGDGRHERS